MSTNYLWSLLSLLLVIGFSKPDQASGTPISLPTSLTGAGATWSSVGNVSFGVGSGVADANFGGQFDAFDSALTLSINGSDVLYPSAADLTGSTITTGAATTGVFSTVSEFFASQSHPVLRALFSITNTSSSDSIASVSLQTNLGSDSATTVLGSSSGDTTFSIADRWVITDDTSGSSDPTITHALYGVGASEMTTVASNTVFEGFGTEGVRADFEFTIAAGATERLLFFLRLDTNVADAGNFATSWTDLSTLGTAGLLEGLEMTEIDEIVNWTVRSNNVPEPSSLLLLLLGITAISTNRRQPVATAPRTV